MTNQKPSDELSKEQILESIGRIVSEGESRGRSPDTGARPPAAPALGARKDDDILDLVDLVDEQGDLIPSDPASKGTPAFSFPPAADPSARGSTEGGRASEEQVLEALKPMLQTWLDTNMPPMVERLVKRELERAARAPEPK